MDNKSSTGNFVVYTNRHTTTAAPKPASIPSTAQKQATMASMATVTF